MNGFLRLSRVIACVMMLASCRESSSSGGVRPAEIRWREGGADLVSGAHAVALPKGELAEAARPPITQDPGGNRLAFATASGEARLVYRVGEGLFLGPRVKAPVDFASVPELAQALGNLFDNAGERRSALVAEVKASLGEPGLVRMLAEGARVEAPAWEETYATLPEAHAAEVRRHLAGLLEPGKPTPGLRRAVTLAPLRDAARAPVLAARIRELTEPVREPRATAVMLRALAASDRSRAAVVACEVLGRAPLDLPATRATEEELDRPGREALVEAALIAVAAGSADCPHVAAHLTADSCLPYFRCGEGGPLTGREASRQDEPLCTKEQLATAVSKELERSPPDVMALAGGTRAPLFALAALASSGKVPASFTSAHARRRYALVQPREPECESDLTPGTRCHCDEAMLRDQACRHPESKSVSVGVCKFDIDDRQKKLLDVSAALPP